jgi:hypothetical protein
MRIDALVDLCMNSKISKTVKVLQAMNYKLDVIKGLLQSVGILKNDRGSCRMCHSLSSFRGRLISQVLSFISTKSDEKELVFPGLIYRYSV